MRGTLIGIPLRVCFDAVGLDTPCRTSLAAESATRSVEHPLRSSNRCRYAGWSNMFWDGGFIEGRTLDLLVTVSGKQWCNLFVWHSRIDSRCHQSVG